MFITLDRYSISMLKRKLMLLRFQFQLVRQALSCKTNVSL